MSQCACQLVALLLHSRKNILFNLARQELQEGARGDRRRCGERREGTRGCMVRGPRG